MSYSLGWGTVNLYSFVIIPRQQQFGVKDIIREPVDYDCFDLTEYCVDAGEVELRRVNASDT
jgi:hypothetical protein